MLSYVFLGCFLTIAICLSVSTAYYRSALSMLSLQTLPKVSLTLNSQEFELSYIWLIHVCASLSVNDQMLMIVAWLLSICIFAVYFLPLLEKALDVFVSIIWKLVGVHRRKLKRLEAQKKGKRRDDERESKRRQENSHRWAAVEKVSLKGKGEKREPGKGMKEGRRFHTGELVWKK